MSAAAKQAQPIAAAIRECRCESITPAHKLLLHTLASRLSATNDEAWPSVERTAEDTGYSTAWVRELLRDLVVWGVLVKRPVWAENGACLASRYAVCTEALHRKEAFPARKSSPSRVKKSQTPSTPVRGGPSTPVQGGTLYPGTPPPGTPVPPKYKGKGKGESSQLPSREAAPSAAQSDLHGIGRETPEKRANGDRIMEQQRAHRLKLLQGGNQ